MIAVIQAELDHPSSPPETQNRLSVDHRAVADFYGLALLNVLRKSGMRYQTKQLTFS